MKPEIGDLVLITTKDAYRKDAIPFLRCMLVLSKTNLPGQVIVFDNYWDHTGSGYIHTRIYAVVLGFSYKNYTVIRDGKIICKE